MYRLAPHSVMFYSSCLLLVALPIATLAEHALTYSDTLDVRTLLSGTHVQYQHHEVHSVEEGPEEDIFYVTKRAPLTFSPGCSDCDDFTPWDGDESASVVRRDHLSRMYQPVNLTQRRVERRANNIKRGSIKCVGGRTIILESPNYPTNEDMDKVRSIQQQVVQMITLHSLVTRTFTISSHSIGRIKQVITN
jgi:hypothetical protein